MLGGRVEHAGEDLHDHLRDPPAAERAEGKPPDRDERGLAPDEAAELPTLRPDCRSDRERATPFGHPDRQHEAGSPRCEQQGEHELQLRESSEVDRRESRERDPLLGDDVLDRRSRRRTEELLDLCRERRRRPVRADQQDLRSRRPRRLGDVALVRDQEGVVWRCRELARHPDVRERHLVIRVVRRELQSQVHRVAGLQLEVVHGLFGDEHAVRGGSERLERLRGVAVREERVRHRRGLADRGGVHAVEILQIVAHVREPVLHLLDGGYTGQPRNGVGDPRRQSARGCRAHRHVGAVGQLGVDT